MVNVWSTPRLATHPRTIFLIKYTNDMQKCIDVWNPTKVLVIYADIRPSTFAGSVDSMISARLEASTTIRHSNLTVIKYVDLKVRHTRTTPAAN